MSPLRQETGAVLAQAGLNTEVHNLTAQEEPNHHQQLAGQQKEPPCSELSDGCISVSRLQLEGGSTAENSATSTKTQITYA